MRIQIKIILIILIVIFNVQFMDCKNKNSNKNGTWISAKELKSGMKVLGADGKWRVITSVEIVKQHVKTYNLEVKDNHTYTVGKESVVVHNECNLNETCGDIDTTSMNESSENNEYFKCRMESSEECEVYNDNMVKRDALIEDNTPFLIFGGIQKKGAKKVGDVINLRDRKLELGWKKWRQELDEASKMIEKLEETLKKAERVLREYDKVRKPPKTPLKPVK